MKNYKQNDQNKNKLPGDSFLEAFRDLGSGAYSSVKDDLLKKGGQDIFNSLSPFKQNSSLPEKPDNRPDFSQTETNLEKRYHSGVSGLENIRREERILFTKEQRETQNQVNLLQEEIKKLAKSTAQLASEAKEAEIAARQEVPLTGTYHINFFEKLRQVITQLSSQIRESSYWLASWNKKAGKRNYYWGKFKKSGGSFSLHHDRSVATQAG